MTPPYMPSRPRTRPSERATNPDLAEPGPLWDREPSSASEITEPRGLLPTEARHRNRATLTAVSGADAGRVYSIEISAMVGRSRECSIRIDDTSVSRIHARIVRTEPGQYLLEDLDSRNGTLVDGVRVRHHELQDGNRVQFGPNAYFRFALSDDQEEKFLQRLYESSVRDPLTGAFNRKHFNERLASEIAYAARHHTALTLVMFDIDHFKAVNDKFGHPAGDRVLKTIATLVGRTVRVEDVLCRYGGEEFTVIARGIDPKGALVLGERIRSIVEASLVTCGDATVPVTVSVGVATIESGGPQTSADKLVEDADQRLYEAKQAGRNRVVGLV